VYLEFTIDAAWKQKQARKLVTTELLGKAAIPNLPYEKPDGTAVRMDRDYFGNKREEKNPFPGPFEFLQGGTQNLKVWPSESAP
jgi:alpha-N-arabinofuranosidase